MIRQVHTTGAGNHPLYIEFINAESTFRQKLDWKKIIRTEEL